MTGLSSLTEVEDFIIFCIVSQSIFQIILKKTYTEGLSHHR